MDFEHQPSNKSGPKSMLYYQIHDPDAIVKIKSKTKKIMTLLEKVVKIKVSKPLRHDRNIFMDIDYFFAFTHY